VAALIEIGNFTADEEIRRIIEGKTALRTLHKAKGAACEGEKLVAFSY
jgi:hypothetical protein